MKDSISLRKELFTKVRDWPYGFDLDNPSRDSSCRSKAQKLQGLLWDIKIVSHIMCCHFRWDSTSLPQNLIKQAPGPDSQHFYLLVFIPETKRFVTVDPTYDTSLKSAGFPIAKWDGLNDTPLAVTPFLTFTPEKSEEICSKYYNSSKEGRRVFKETYGGFYDNFNRWIAHQRSGVEKLHA